jgi:N utilization substance protein B
MSLPRHFSRKACLQHLYSLEVNQKTVNSNINPLDDFSESLVKGVLEHKASIDELIEKNSHHWKKERMSLIDRNILRLGVYELIYREDIPMTVTINEMIELAKEFGSEHSGSFINGILDSKKAYVDQTKKISEE